jgi:uncharacterized protein (UPF0264 family)
LARLLVSVRNAVEARAAIEGGADVIDVKEPLRGPLGRADAKVWAEVRRAAPASTAVSVALGELVEWEAGGRSVDWGEGLSYCKVGLSGLCDDPEWPPRWERLVEDGGPPLVAVVYADAAAARAPSPDAVIDAALGCDACAGVLFDTWDKSAPSPIDASWARRFRRVQSSGRFVALAGRVDLDVLPALAPLRPDIVAIRGAACRGGDRLAPIDPLRVARLARAAARV